jgi:hypothetical protein
MGPVEMCVVERVTFQLPPANEDDSHAIFAVVTLRRLSDRSGREAEAPNAVDRPQHKFSVGDKVKARWKGAFRFPGTITKCNADGTYVVSACPALCLTAIAPIVQGRACR